MTTLKVVLEQMVATVPGGIGRYTEELTRALLTTAPTGCDVEGLISLTNTEKAAELEASLPGITGISRLPIPHRELQEAWRRGLFTSVGTGLVHSPSLLAPLAGGGKNGLLDRQIVVTVHDTVPWTHPKTMTPRGVRWHKAMAKRAAKHADAIVVPTHAVARELSELFPLGDRIRVIGGAPSTALRLPEDPATRAAELGLPADFVLFVGTLEPRKGLRDLIAAMTRPEVGDLPLVIAGPEGWGDINVAQIAAEAGLDEGRLKIMGYVSDSDLAVCYASATVLVCPSIAEGFGLPVVEALRFGTPVIHSDDPALVETAGGAGIAVELAEPQTFADRLAEAIASVAGDTALSERFRVQGMDRARAFSWIDSGEKVWQLHADL